MMIEAEGLSKYYGSLKALDNLTFSVGKGEIVGFLGPNGAGKSTAMNILTGFLSLSAGNVRISGHDIFKEAQEARSSVGYLPEQPPLYLELTVMEFLHHVCGLKKIRRKVWKRELDRILAMCSLTEVAHRKIAHLSKGFRQRVGLAQALAGSPPLLIFDEPTVGLDPQQILEIRNLIRQLSKEHTILLSSHILSEIEAVCQRVLILNQGQLIADDATDRLKQRLNAESYQLELELLGPENRHDALAAVLAEQGIANFRLHTQAILGQRDTPSLYHLKFQVPPEETPPRQGSAATIPFLLQRRALGQALSREGFVSIAMIPHQSSLEETFLSLTSTASAKPAIQPIEMPEPAAPAEPQSPGEDA